MLCTFCAVASVDVDKIPLSADVDPRQIMEILRSRGVEIMQGVYPSSIAVVLSGIIDRLQRDCAKQGAPSGAFVVS